MALCGAEAAISNETLIEAFINVFEFQDMIATVSVEPIQMALTLLRANSVADIDHVCNMSEAQQALMLMQNARAAAEQQLRDQRDWRIYVHEHGFRRERSYNSVRFAVVETLLLVTVVGLGYLIWAKMPLHAGLGGAGSTGH